MSLVLLTLTACTGAEDNLGAHGIAFVLPPADLGAARAAASGIDVTDGDALGRALDATLPVFGEPLPLWEIPGAVWAILQREDVRNEGVCPIEVVRDGATVHEGGCRTSYGYDIAGDVSERAWDEDGAARELLEADVEVIGDVEDPVFERITMSGSLLKVVPDDDSVTAHYDVNLALEVLGYWEQRADDDPRALTWSSWIVSGSVEEVAGRWTVDLTADIGGAGGVTITSEALVEKSTCPIELEGNAGLTEGVTASFTAASCDACASISHGGGTTEACQP